MVQPETTAAAGLVLKCLTAELYCLHNQCHKLPWWVPPASRPFQSVWQLQSDVGATGAMVDCMTVAVRC